MVRWKRAHPWQDPRKSWVWMPTYTSLQVSLYTLAQKRRAGKPSIKHACGHVAVRSYRWCPADPLMHCPVCCGWGV